MSNYIGIDLGTTNSAICSYDGTNVRVWKSPEQNDVTPSAIYIDRRGNRYYGQRAYDNAPRNPKNSAVLFKRFMGTSTKIELKDSGVVMTPSECSAEILKVLYGYLPEEIRNSEDTAVVITVPAAFNQMKKDATLEAAHLAGFEKVALMQEPVAAVMSVMRQSKHEGIFLVYDLGGGTFDVSIAENIAGKVNLLSHGGIEMCGGRDWDRIIVNEIVIPWLFDNFSLPEDFRTNEKYKTLLSLIHNATEKAKIELSSKERSVIALDEGAANCMDMDGEEVYVDVPISRNDLDGFISDYINETIEATRNTMSKAGLSANDIERIVFVGGPTNYKPLRDRVCFELSLKTDESINPMTAVAEGASIFAESIDWSTENRGRKKESGEMTAESVSLKYTARTANDNAKVMFVIGGGQTLTVEITSLDTGWISGRTEVKNGSMLELPLSVSGENRFKVNVFDGHGAPVSLENNIIVITKTIASIGAIPASKSIGVEVINTIGGSSSLEFLVKEGDDLPKKGQKRFKAAQTLKAGSFDSINIKLWEGDIESPVTDNRFIGVLKIVGTDFDSGVITTGSEIICDYEMTDSGNINLDISIPSIGAIFNNKNFYSRQEGQEDALDTERISDNGALLLERIDAMETRISDDRLVKARQKALDAAEINDSEHDLEDIQKASEDLLEAKQLIFEARKEHLAGIRQAELDSCVDFFNNVVRKYTNSAEETAFDNQVLAAQRSIDRDDDKFENQLDELKGKNFAILWRQDWFVIDMFNRMVDTPYNFSNPELYKRLKTKGEESIDNDRINDLRQIVIELSAIQIRETSVEDMVEKANIIRG